MSERKLILLPEPQLQFAHSQLEEHPKDGLFLYGPADKNNNLETLKIGMIGPAHLLDLLDDFGKLVTGYIPPYDENRAHHTAFPGLEAAFGLRWPNPATARLSVSSKELERAIRLHNRHEAIKRAVDIYADKIQSYLKEEADVTPEFWFVVIPDDVFQWGRPTKMPPSAERVKGEATLKPRTAKGLLKSPSLFEEDNKEAELQLYDLNFHNQLKARLLNITPVQIIRERTLHGILAPREEQYKHKVQDPATIAWNLCTTSYYKSFGPPWRLKDIRPGVCYVGLVFKKDPSDPDKRNACCGAQLFLRSGEGLVFRGAVGEWYSERLRQFHLSREKAAELMQLVCAAYEQKHGKPPDEIFIHGRSRFGKAEWAGFQEGCSQGTNVVGIRIRPTDDLKLFRQAKKPVIRGTCLIRHKRLAYLWTKGYVPRFDTYPGFETPNPIAVHVDWGEADIETVAADILALTKVNFNGCNFADGLPVTLKFADAIGEILTAAPSIAGAPLPFKFYI
ncbi:MAG: hypothetical protein CL559_13835 [Alphaproteobacteria bacterium]|nr:hypothetical protein [Alphaproteobacteria bacterium]